VAAQKLRSSITTMKEEAREVRQRCPRGDTLRGYGGFFLRTELLL
jgi:hypothetical protein